MKQVMLNMHGNVLVEKDKQQKLLDRYHGLCAQLQRDIDSAAVVGAGGSSGGSNSSASGAVL
jgi:hypothetical protein